MKTIILALALLLCACGVQTTTPDEDTAPVQISQRVRHAETQTVGVVQDLYYVTDGDVEGWMLEVEWDTGELDSQMYASELEELTP